MLASISEYIAVIYSSKTLFSFTLKHNISFFLALSIHFYKHFCLWIWQEITFSRSNYYKKAFAVHIS